MSSNADSLFNQGLQHYREGKFAEALQCFQEGLTLDQGHWEMHLYKGMCQARLGNLVEAKREFLNVRDFCPSNEFRTKAAAALGALSPAISQQSMQKLSKHKEENQ